MIELRCALDAFRDEHIAFPQAVTYSIGGCARHDARAKSRQNL
jgi:hypothetical protein